MALSYRNQWPGIGNAYKSYSLSYDQYIEEYKSGVGVLLMRDDRGGGMLVTQDAGLLYSYEIEVTHEIFVRPGIQFKYAERKIDPSKIIYGNQIGEDGSVLPGQIPTFDRLSYKKFDASVSAMVYSDYFWLGFTLDHLVKGNVGFTDLETNVPMRTSIFGGYKYTYKDGYRDRDEQSLTLAINYYKQDFFNQMDAGIYWYINPIELGVLYRGLPIANSEGFSNRDAIIMMGGINYGPMRIAYSYDLTMSDLAGYSNGANEISLIYRFNQTFKKRTSRGAIPCGAPGVVQGGSAKYRSAPRKIF